MAQEVKTVYVKERGGLLRGFGVLFIVIIILICLLVMLCGGMWTLFVAASGIETTTNGELKYDNVYGESKPGRRLLSITISGPILTNVETEGSGFGLFGEPLATYGYQVKDKLYKAAEDESIKGIILEINSPGGTITGSKAIADGISYYREKTKNPVIAHISGIGASGAYWVAASADYIMVDAGSITGSIGVIYGPFKYYDNVVEEGSILGNVVTQNGIETRYFTGGEHKDFGNPYRRLTAEEIKVIQESIDNEYSEFVKFVASRRNVTEATVRNNIKALTYDNKQAITLKLADKQASREEAYTELAKRAELGGDYEVVRIDSATGFFEALLGADSKSGKPSVSSNSSTVQSCVLCDRPLYFHGNPEMVVKY